MTAIPSAASPHLGTPPPPADDRPATQTGSCGCDRVIAAFESAAGPRRKRGATDDDIVECLDPATPETEPATMVQHIPV